MHEVEELEADKLIIIIYIIRQWQEIPDAEKQ